MKIASSPKIVGNRISFFNKKSFLNNLVQIEGGIVIDFLFSSNELKNGMVIEYDGK